MRVKVEREHRALSPRFKPTGVQCVGFPVSEHHNADCRSISKIFQSAALEANYISKYN